MNSRLSPLLYLSNNWISRLGVLLVTAAAVFWLFLLPTYLGGHAGSAYIGILLFLIIPVAFFAGLGLIPLGISLMGRKKTIELDSLPPLNWQNPEMRKLVWFVSAVTVANLIIGASFAYRAVEHMETANFCGATCHVMKPEYTAYKASAHSNVECAKCHIGPGAASFVKAKLAGVNQVIGVMTGHYPRPIPAPVEGMRPASETCEGCHARTNFGSDRLKVSTHFGDQGEETKSVVMMKISTIHRAHLADGVAIRFAYTEPRRQTIPWVEVRKQQETLRYENTKDKIGDTSRLPVRAMDCMDCHNRPSHTLEVPERAVDAAMADGRIVRDLPGVKPLAVEILRSARSEADVISSMEKRFKEKNAEVERSAKALAGIWARNVFPEMNVSWGSYPNNNGHNDYPGCFRCHSDDQKTGAGKALGQDCNTCHGLLAMEEKSPKILTDLGVQ